MTHDLTPTEARSGWISHRVIFVLLISATGAALALGLTWLFMLG